MNNLILVVLYSSCKQKGSLAYLGEDDNENYGIEEFLLSALYQ